MKKTILLAGALALVGCLSSVHATIIELTPGGFNWADPPPVVSDWWANYGSHNYYTIDESLFTVTGWGTPEITLSWDLTGPGRLRWLFVASQNGESNFFQIIGHHSYSGEATFTTDGVTPIDQNGAWRPIVPYGRSPYSTPDGGTTAGLLGLGFAALAAVKRFR